MARAAAAAADKAAQAQEQRLRLKEASLPWTMQRVLRHHQAFFEGVVENGAVVKARALFIGIGVGIKVNQCQRAMLTGMGAQQRQADVVVAAQRQHLFARFQPAHGVGFQVV